MQQRILPTLCLSLIFSANASGSDDLLSDPEHECFSLSMIGYDSVVNNQVGLPIEIAIHAMQVNNHNPDVKAIYLDKPVKIVAEAYSWKGSPHDFAVRILFRCATQHSEQDPGAILSEYRRDPVFQ